MRILIVTHYFPPINNIASSRPYYWAKYWKEAGHDIQILSTLKTPKDKPLDYYPENLSELNVKELAYWPYASIPQKNIPRVSDADIIKYVNAASWGLKFLKVLSDIRKSILPLPLNKVWWIRPAVRYAMDLYKYWRYDAVISTFSPLATHIVASILKKNLDIVWVADYRDPFTGNHYKNVAFPFSLLTASVEKYFLKRADLISTVSEPIRSRLCSYFRKPAITIENGFDPAEYRAISENYFSNNDKIRLIYTGTIYPDKQDPSPLFRAIKNLKKEIPANTWRLEVRFFYQCPDSDYLESLIKKYEVADCITAAGFVDRATSLQLQREADALIFLDWNDDLKKGVLTGKIFEYMYSGKPILSIGGSEDSVANRMIKESGTGVILKNNVEQIQREIKTIINKQNSAYNPSDSFLKRYHKKQLADKFLNQIYKLAGRQSQNPFAI